MTKRQTRLQRSLPAPLDAIVGQIETEIGELFGADGEPDADSGAELGVPERVLAPHGPGDDGRAENAVREILTEIGEDPDREGLVATPARVHRMYRELLAGYQVDPGRLLNGAIFE